MARNAIDGQKKAGEIAVLKCGASDGGQPMVSSDRMLTSHRTQLHKKHMAVIHSLTDAVKHSIEAGQILLEVKATLAPGTFQQWIESLPQCAFPLSLRTAQRYMRVAANVDEITARLREQADATRASSASDEELWSGVSIREAMRLIADQRPALVKPILKEERDDLTPWPLIESVRQCLGTIDLDPCGSAQAPDHVGARLVWTEIEDGLAADKTWTGRVFVHPPHSERKMWVDRSLAEIAAGNAEALLLLIPVVSDDAAFLSLKHCPRGFIGSRIDGFDSPGVVFALGDVEVSRFAETFVQHGDVFVPVSDQ